MAPNCDGVKGSSAGAKLVASQVFRVLSLSFVSFPCSGFATITDIR